MKKLTNIILLILAAMLLCTACAGQEIPLQDDEPAAIPEAAPEITPEPMPEQPAFDSAAASERMKELISENLVIDISAAEGLPENMFAEEDEWNIFGSAQEQRAWLVNLPETVVSQIDHAQKTASMLFNEEYPEFSEFSSVIWVNLQHPSWQYLYALTKGADDITQANDVITKSIGYSVDIAAQENDEYRMEIKFEAIPYRDAIALLGKDELQSMSIGFSYSYCITVYNELAEEQEYIQPEAEGNLLNGITWPLASHTRLRKTWYADRDGGSRKHTGTDIWAAADTELYSCTDGTVTFVGSGGGMGNAVVITDEYGYEFHYYHMIRPTDFLAEGDTVKAGDLIGHVGNTGNSSRDHLHLTIVASDGYYINPYPYLLSVEP